MNPFTFLAKAMADGENPSAMRVAMLYGVGVIVAVWAIVAISKSEVVAFPQSVIEVLGLLVLGKVAQAHFESKTPPPATP